MENMFPVPKNVIEIRQISLEPDVALCCISTGVFHFPNKRAAEIAVFAVTEWMGKHLGTMERVVRLVTFSYIFRIFRNAFSEISAAGICYYLFCKHYMHL